MPRALSGFTLNHDPAVAAETSMSLRVIGKPLLDALIDLLTSPVALGHAINPIRSLSLSAAYHSIRY